MRARRPAGSRLDRSLGLRGILLPPKAYSPLCLQGTPVDLSLWGAGDAELVAAVTAGRKVTRAGAGGRFSFTGLEPGTYRLRVVAPGFAEYLSPPIDVPAGPDEELPVRLKKGSVLSGRAMDADGIPRPRLLVVLRRGTDHERTTRTDESGTFEFKNVAPGDGYTIEPREVGKSGRPARQVAVPEGKDVFVSLGY